MLYMYLHVMAQWAIWSGHLVRRMRPILFDFCRVSINSSLLDDISGIYLY